MSGIKRIKILLLSEVFLTKDLLDSALSKSNLCFQVAMTGSMNDAQSKISFGNYQIFITDNYMIETISGNFLTQMIGLNPNISFLLISYSLDEASILRWFDFGFKDVVISDNPLGLILSIKRETRHDRVFGI